MRLDAGAAYPGAIVSPFFDSMLVKITTWGRTLEEAIQRGNRALREFRIRGVKNNIGFLENVLEHPLFIAGDATVTFFDNHPELFNIVPVMDRATKTLTYLADISINGNPDIKSLIVSRFSERPPFQNMIAPRLVRQVQKISLTKWVQKNSVNGSRHRNRFSTPIQPSVTPTSPCLPRGSEPAT